MSTLYEIHITVKLESALDEIKWIWFCKENKYKYIRVLNTKGDNDIQNMISKWCSRSTHNEAVDHANKIAHKIEKKRV